MSNLIRPNQIQFMAQVSEDDLRRRLAQEVMESIGAIDADGKPLAGVSASVKRGEGRTGGYRITVTGPMPTRALLGRDREVDA